MTRELIEYVARSLVDQPDSLVVTETAEDGVTIYRLKVAPRDLGKVIGRRGRVARAGRPVLAHADPACDRAGSRLGGGTAWADPLPSDSAMSPPIRSRACSEGVV